MALGNGGVSFLGGGALVSAQQPGAEPGPGRQVDRLAEREARRACLRHGNPVDWLRATRRPERRLERRLERWAERMGSMTRHLRRGFAGGGARGALLLAAGLALSACATPGGPGMTVDPGAVAATSPAYFRDTVGDRVLFEVDRTSLTPAARATLDGQADWLARNTAYAATIEGHADEQGTREYNLALGARRAASVQDYLISRGVAGERLRTVSYGKERPAAVCSDESCYARNRRAVTVLQGAGGS